MLNRNTWRLSLRTLALLIVATGLFPNVHHQGGDVRTADERDHLLAHPDSMPSRTDVTLGWRASPAFRYYRESTLTVKDGTIKERRAWGGIIGWLSWSAVSIVAGIVLFRAAGRLFPATATPNDQPTLRETSSGGIG